MVAVRSWKCAFLATSVLLSGCAGLRNGAPAIVELSEAGQEFAIIRNRIMSDCLNVDSQTGSAEVQQAQRNRLVTAYVLAVDLRYNAYERNLLDAMRENDLGASTASLALSTIGTVVGNANLVDALNVTNTLVTGTHTAIGRDYLINQTLTTLQTQMRASRAAQRTHIMERLSRPYTGWDSCTALSDVQVYEQAGTLNAAIAAVAASAAQANRENDALAQRAIDRVAFTVSPLADALNAYFTPPNDDTLMAARIGRAKELLSAAGIAVPARTMPGDRLTLILVGANPAELRALAIAVLQVESDQSAKAPIVRALTQ